MISHSRMFIRLADLRRGTFKAALVLASMVLLLMGAMLASSRNQAWSDAAQHTDNVRQSIIGEIQSQLDLYGTTLDLAAGFLGGAEASRPSQETAALTLKRMVRSLEVAGLINVLDKDGRTIMDSNGRVDGKVDLSDRPYFKVHRDRTDVDLYLSHPYFSRLRNDEPTIALSRRISDANGNFVGVVVAAIRLEHFKKLFSRIDLGERGALSLVNTDGVMLMRTPSTDGKGDVGRDVSGSINLRRAAASSSGSHIAVAAIDGVERFVSFGRVERFPLVVFVSVSTGEILADWWQQAIVVGGSSVVVCGAILVLALGLRRKIEELEVARQALFLAASTDQLTGLANRREFDALTRREWQRARRERAPLSILMVDADHFKRVNDEFGHAEGDEVLKTVAHSIRESLKRAGDVAARYGGEEFAVVLPNTDARGALGVAEVVRRAVLAASEEARRSGRPGVTVSVGAASTVPSMADSVERLIETADRALYEAKRLGRNQSWMAEQESGTVVPLRPVFHSRQGGSSA